MEITTRAATAGDTEFARGVHHAAYRDVVERQFGPWDEAFQDQKFASRWQPSVFRIVLCDATPCGFLWVEQHADHVGVREIVIAPEFQGRGIGSILLKQVLERAAARNVPVRLSTPHVNRAAVLYRRLGFRETGRTATHILFEWTPPAGRTD